MRAEIGSSPAALRSNAVLVVLVTLVALTACGCSGGDSGSDKGETATRISTAPVPRLAQRDAPLQVSVRKVAGALSKTARASVRSAASKPVRQWLELGFVGGAYPRTDFSSAYRVFTAGAAQSARNDKALLTNGRLGPRLVDVAAERRTAKLSVLAVHGHPRGVSARVHLLLLGVHRDESRITVQLTGDVYLTRAPDGAWKIFGYDLTRNVGSR